MSHVYVIAEAGINHDGSEKKAFELIDVAVEAGADAVKFQLFNPAKLVAGLSPALENQQRNLKNSIKSQRQMLDLLTLSPEVMGHLAQHCALRKIDFLCTPFDQDSLEYLVTQTRMPYLKLASAEVTNGPLLLAAARSGLPVILSTGMSDLEEINTALSILHFGFTHAEGIPSHVQSPTPLTLKYLRDYVVLLHCVSQYPASAQSMNLRAMDTLADAFGLPVGFSDHSLGATMAVAAAARGAVAIEKQFTYDSKAKGPDHASSLNPEGLKACVAAIRDVSAAIGNGEKNCQPEEFDSRALERRSVVAAQFITIGEEFTEAHLTCKRPGTGLAPNYMWDLLGKQAKRSYASDDLIDEKELD